MDNMDNIDTYTDTALIEQLGGTTAVAKICSVKPQAVSQWKRNGIPKTVRILLELYIKHR